MPGEYVVLDREASVYVRNVHGEHRKKTIMPGTILKVLRADIFCEYELYDGSTFRSYYGSMGSGSFSRSDLDGAYARRKLGVLKTRLNDYLWIPLIALATCLFIALLVNIFSLVFQSRQVYSNIMLICGFGFETFLALAACWCWATFNPAPLSPLQVSWKTFVREWSAWQNGERSVAVK